MLKWWLLQLGFLSTELTFSLAHFRTEIEKLKEEREWSKAVVSRSIPFNSLVSSFWSPSALTQTVFTRYFTCFLVSVASFSSSSSKRHFRLLVLGCFFVIFLFYYMNSRAEEMKLSYIVFPIACLGSWWVVAAWSSTASTDKTTAGQKLARDETCERERERGKLLILFLWSGNPLWSSLLPTFSHSLAVCIKCQITVPFYARPCWLLVWSYYYCFLISLCAWSNRSEWKKNALTRSAHTKASNVADNGSKRI